MLTVRHLDASNALVPLGSLPESLVEWIWSKKGIQENLAIMTAQCKQFMLSYSASGDFLCTAHNELRQGTAGEIRGMLEEGFLLVRESGFEPCGLGGDL
jgi:hypothetical protein